MPKVSNIQTSFSAGELSPTVYGRVDAERYKSGLQTALNYLPTLQGPIIRRPGTKFVNNVKDSANPPVLVPFKFSETQAYTLEFGDRYIRFYTNGGQVITNSNSFKISGFDNFTLFFDYNATRSSPIAKPGDIITSSSLVAPSSVLELVSPYGVADVANIKYTQNGDTLYLTHPSYAVYKMQRTALNEWQIKRVQFQDGPYLPLNSYSSTGDSPTVTLTPSSATIGVLETGLSLQVVGTANNGAGLIRITSPFVGQNLKTGDKVVILNVPGTVEANNTNATLTSKFWQIKVIDTIHFDLLGSTFVNACTGSSGFIYPALFQPGSDTFSWLDTGRNVGLVSGGIRYWGYIINVNDMAHAQFQLAKGQTLPNTSTIQIWQLGTWTQFNGSTASTPSACCFHQNRLAFAGTPNFPQEVDLSASNQYENFAATGSSLVVADSNALQFNLNSADLNAIRWLKSTSQGLLAGTQTSEWMITPSGQSQALTPTNFNASQTSYFGSANIDAVQAANATLHVQRAQRRLREMNYFFQVGTFRSTDLSELSDHITLPAITKLAVQKETLPIIWAVRSDGILLSMAYNRDDTTLKAGWARHQLGGQSDSAGTNPIVKSIAVIPSSDTSFDQLWLVVQRSTISGSSFTTIEYMTKPFDDTFVKEDAFQGDCGITFDAAKTISLISLASSHVLITSNSHGFANNDEVKITDVVGLNSSFVDINGNSTITNLVNEKTFLVGSSSANTFTLLDINTSVAVNSASYGNYVSGGNARKMVLTISGLDWLKGETVGILADGGIHPDVVVSQSSSITLNYRAAKVQIGYRFNSDGNTLRTEAGSAQGTSIGSTRRIDRCAFMLHNVGEIQVGGSFTELRPWQLSQADQNQADIAPPLFSGIIRDGLEDGYDFDDALCFRQNSMLPGMIQAITIFMEEFDV